MERQFVGFKILNEKYCIDIMDVKEVVRENKITKLPDAPFFVQGIMNLRGIVVPVISVKKKLGLDIFDDSVKNTPTDNSNNSINKNTSDKMIIVTIESVLIGFVVDSLERVFSIDTSQIQAPEKVSESSNIDRNLIEGVVKVDENIYLILDIKKLLAIEEKSYIKKEVIE